MVKKLDNGKVQIGNRIMVPYAKAVRGKVSDLAEIDTFYAKTPWGQQGFSAPDDTWTRSVFSPFYTDCLAGLKSLEAAVNKALGVEDIYKPEVRAGRQIALVLPALTNLLKSMEKHAQAIKDKGALTDSLLADALEPDLATKGEQTIVEALMAQEIRAAFRALPTDEARSLALQKKLLKDGDVFTLRAIKDDPVGLLPDVFRLPIEVDYVKTVAPWLYVKRDDDAHLWREIKGRIQLIQGFATTIMAKTAGGSTISYPRVSPWSDGRFFTESSEGFVLRLPVIPEAFNYGQRIDPVWWSRHEAEFSARIVL